MFFASFMPLLLHHQIEFGDEGDVQITSCECSMGDYMCHHVAAALLFGWELFYKTRVLSPCPLKLREGGGRVTSTCIPDSLCVSDWPAWFLGHNFSLLWNFYLKFHLLMCWWQEVEAHEFLWLIVEFFVFSNDFSFAQMFIPVEHIEDI